MKTKFYFLIVLSAFSCASVKELSSNTYVYRSKNRVLELYFTDNNTCVFKNTFKCTDIDPEFKNIVMECDYKRIGDTIFVNKKGISSNYDLYLNIPPQESVKCDFLNQENRERTLTTSPAYTTNYEKNGLVPNINQDTLYIIENKIVLFKKNINQSIGFIFKR